MKPPNTDTEAVVSLTVEASPLERLMGLWGMEGITTVKALRAFLLTYQASNV